MKKMADLKVSDVAPAPAATNGAAKETAAGSTDSKAQTQQAQTGPLPVCANAGCGKASTMQCPRCVELKIAKTNFCSQECFKAAWKTHNRAHQGTLLAF